MTTHKEASWKPNAMSMSCRLQLPSLNCFWVKVYSKDLTIGSLSTTFKKE